MDEIAYAAGFFDGEGSVGIYRDSPRMDRQGHPRVRPGHNHTAVLQVGGYARAPMDRLTQLFGGHVTSSQVSVTGRRVYLWRLNAQGAVEAALRRLSPHLLVKRAEAELTLRFLEWRHSIKRTTGPRIDRSFNPWEIAEAESFALALKDLKRDPAGVA